MSNHCEFIETQAPRSCEMLGVCQNPERECQGACELPPKLLGELIDSPESSAAQTDFVDLALVVLICLAAGGIGATLVDVWPPYLLSVFA